MICCGKDRATRHCPDCGARMGDAAPVATLLAHVRAEAAKLRRWLSDNDCPQAMSKARKATAVTKLTALRRLEGWEAAVLALLDGAATAASASAPDQPASIPQKDVPSADGRTDDAFP